MSQRVGNYIIDRTLSAGGMATIHLGHHAELGRQVVIKQLHPHLSRDEGFVRRFEREAKILGALHHQNIVDVLDYFEHQDSYYIVLEYIDGGSLKELLEQQRRMPFHIAVLVALQVASGLQYAHQRGIVHRDVKPGNVLLSRSGQVKLTDFGLASATEALAITDPGTFVGTPAYLAPEQIRGQPATALSDLYALGVVLYEMLAGENPFSGKTHSESIDRTLRVVPKGLPRTDPEVPPGLSRIVLKLLSKEPRDRYPSCRELIEELELYRLIKPEALTRYLAAPASYQPRQEDQAEINRLVAREKRNLLLARAVQGLGLAVLALLLAVFGVQQARELLRQHAAQRRPAGDSAAVAPMPPAAPVPRQIVKVLGTENSDISINGKPAGRIPAIFDDLKPGVMTFAVGRPGYATQQRTIRLRQGESVTAVFELVPLAQAPGYLLLSVKPWAEVYIDGRFIDRTPLSGAVQLAAGAHQLFLRHPNRKEFSQQLAIAPDDTTIVAVTMPEASGYLKLTVSPWAAVQIDGEDQGITPLGQPLRLSLGEHQLRLTGPEGREWKETIVIREGQTTERQITMP